MIQICMHAIQKIPYDAVSLYYARARTRVHCICTTTRTLLVLLMMDSVAAKMKYFRISKLGELGKQERFKPPMTRVEDPGPEKSGARDQGERGAMEWAVFFGPCLTVGILRCANDGRGAVSLCMVAGSTSCSSCMYGEFSGWIGDLALSLPRSACDVLLFCCFLQGVYRTIVP
jgi:hypothetical protein